MLELELKEAIKKFVKAFRVVRVRQINKFFDDWGKVRVEKEIRHLTESQILHPQGTEDYISLVRPEQRPNNLVSYHDTCRCIDMMVGLLHSGEVNWFDAADYPLNIRFLTAEDELYDVSYLDERNWSAKSVLLPIAWKKTIPEGQQDPVNHIAVIPNLDVAQNLRDVGFSQFVVVDYNGGILGIYDNE